MYACKICNRPSQRYVLTPILFSFIQQAFVEPLLCIRHCISIENIKKNNTGFVLLRS